MKNYKEICPCCFEKIDNCICGGKRKCSICKKEFCSNELYEYRGIITCSKCMDVAIIKRDSERAEIIEENKIKTEKFRGLDFSDSQIGKANREILKREIEIAKKENSRLRKYERGELR